MEESSREKPTSQRTGTLPEHWEWKEGSIEEEDTFTAGLRQKGRDRPTIGKEHVGEVREGGKEGGTTLV